LETSNSAKEALEYLKKNTFDLILLDMVLPDMSGYQLMDFITIQNQDTLIIVITGQASMDSAIGALRKGAYDYIRKPFEPDALITTFKNALNQKSLILLTRTIATRYCNWPVKYIEASRTLIKIIRI